MTELAVSFIRLTTLQYQQLLNTAKISPAFYRQGTTTRKNVSRVCCRSHTETRNNYRRLHREWEFRLSYHSPPNFRGNRNVHDVVRQVESEFFKGMGSNKNRN